MTTITFGKHNGKTTNEVAMIDEGYAKWAAANLKSAAWRKAFADALDALPEKTVEQVAMARFRADDDPGASLDDYLNHAREEREDELEYQRRHEAVAEIIRRWATEAGQPVEKIFGVVNRFIHMPADEWQSIPASQFSTPKQFELFQRCMAEIDAL